MGTPESPSLELPLPLSELLSRPVPLASSVVLTYSVAVVVTYSVVVAVVVEVLARLVVLMWLVEVWTWLLVLVRVASLVLLSPSVMFGGAKQ